MHLKVNSRGACESRLCNFPPLSETSKSDSILARRPSTLCEIPPHSRPMVRSVLSKTSDCPPQYDGLLRQSTDKIRAGSAGSTDCKNRPTGPDTIRFDSPREPFETMLFLLPAISLSRARPNRLRQITVHCHGRNGTVKFARRVELLIVRYQLERRSKRKTRKRRQKEGRNWLHDLLLDVYICLTS